jgi:hypothetical protein
MKKPTETTECQDSWRIERSLYRLVRGILTSGAVSKIGDGPPGE